jgi:hypothetical protein
MALPLEHKDALRCAKRMRCAGHHKEAAAELKRAYRLLVVERHAAELALSNRLGEILGGMHAVKAEIARLKKAAEK